MKSALTRRMVSALVVLSTVALLSGCGASRAGAAVTLKGDSISVDELQAMTQNYLKAAPGSDRADAQKQILNRLIASRVIAKAAAARGVTVPEGQIAAERDRVLQEVGGRAKLVEALAQNREVLPPTYINQWARDRMLVNRLVETIAEGGDPNTPEVGQQVSMAFVTAAKSLNITVNPRYGTWNSEQLELAALVGGGLSKSVTERTTPSPQP